MPVFRRTQSVLAMTMAAAVLGVAQASPASAVPIGKVRQGKATYYNDAGTGACGKPLDASTQMLVAVSPKYWKAANPNHDPLCKVKVRLTFRGKTITVPVRDKCMECGPNHIDLSQPAFAKLANPSKGVIHKVKWKFVR
ncbi:cysteine/serine endopeptidase inhibitor [Streptomyces sp. Marseille-Q5077]|uniref:cysteine/serine endopeptidase inhibitor n=1 Tax=Streptomyces sp. Marseille-Q5077 TaxID=3418995 RepID=UPI003D05FF93